MAPKKKIVKKIKQKQKQKQTVNVNVKIDQSKKGNRSVRVGSNQKEQPRNQFIPIPHYVPQMQYIPQYAQNQVLNPALLETKPIQVLGHHKAPVFSAVNNKPPIEIHNRSVMGLSLQNDIKERSPTELHGIRSAPAVLTNREDEDAFGKSSRVKDDIPPQIDIPQINDNITVMNMLPRRPSIAKESPVIKAPEEPLAPVIVRNRLMMQEPELDQIQRENNRLTPQPHRGGRAKKEFNVDDRFEIGGLTYNIDNITDGRYYLSNTNGAKVAWGREYLMKKIRESNKNND